jgi:hypothetical protein
LLRLEVLDDLPPSRKDVIPPETLSQLGVTFLQGVQDGLVFPKAAVHVTRDV